MLLHTLKMTCSWDGPPNSPEAAWQLLTHMNAYSIALGLVLTLGSMIAQVPQVRRVAAAVWGDPIRPMALTESGLGCGCSGWRSFAASPARASVSSRCSLAT